MLPFIPLHRDLFVPSPVGLFFVGVLADQAKVGTVLEHGADHLAVEGLAGFGSVARTVQEMGDLAVRVMAGGIFCEGGEYSFFFFLVRNEYALFGLVGPKGRQVVILALRCFFVLAFLRLGAKIAAVPFRHELEHTLREHAREAIFIFGELGDGKDLDTEIGAEEGLCSRRDDCV